MHLGGPRRSLDHFIFDACQPALGTITHAILTYADRAYTNSIDLRTMTAAHGDVCSRIRQHTSACTSGHNHKRCLDHLSRRPIPYVSIRPHTSACVSIRQHTVWMVRSCASSSIITDYCDTCICQHTSAYVSIR